MAARRGGGAASKKGEVPPSKPEPAVPKPEIHTETRRLGPSFAQFDVFWAQPSPSDKPSPAIVIVHTIRGLTEHEMAIARSFAELGFVAVAPDLYSHQRMQIPTDDALEVEQILLEVPFAGTFVPGFQQAISTRSRQDQERLRKAARVSVFSPDPNTVSDLKVCVSALAATPGVDAQRISCLGLSMGGGYAWTLATVDPRVRATIVAYGRPLLPYDQLAGLKGAVLSLMAGEDQRLVDLLPEIEAEMAASGRTFTCITYPGVRHGFLNPRSSAYHPDFTRDSFFQILEFLQDSLGELPPEGARARTSKELPPEAAPPPRGVPPPTPAAVVPTPSAATPVAPATPTASPPAPAAAVPEPEPEPEAVPLQAPAPAFSEPEAAPSTPDALPEAPPVAEEGEEEAEAVASAPAEGATDEELSSSMEEEEEVEKEAPLEEGGPGPEPALPEGTEAETEAEEPEEVEEEDRIEHEEPAPPPVAASRGKRGEVTAADVEVLLKRTPLRGSAPSTPAPKGPSRGSGSTSRKEKETKGKEKEREKSVPKAAPKPTPKPAPPPPSKSHTEPKAKSSGKEHGKPAQKAKEKEREKGSSRKH